MNYNDASNVWNVKFPDSIEQIKNISPNKGVIINKTEVKLPWPPLDPKEIVSAKEVAKDWGLKSAFVPIMGDFHDLVCLDYSKGTFPEIVIIDDNRNELSRFSSFESFLEALIDVKEEENEDNLGIIEGSTWLNI